MTPSPPAGADDLPPYRIRESARSRHVRLKVSAERGLEAIIPQGYDRALIPDILASKRDWIAQALQRIQSQVDCRSATRHLPDSLSLAAVDRHWCIYYVPAGSVPAGSVPARSKPTVKLRSLTPDQIPGSCPPPSPLPPSETGASWSSSPSMPSPATPSPIAPPMGPPAPAIDPTVNPAVAPAVAPLEPVEVLWVQGDRHDPATRAALCRWLKRYAKTTLVPWLAQVAQECEFSYERVQIRDQKTRWASCSSYQTIGLNYHLLFLPPTLVRYVLIHELCHTRELNHSPRFWALVERYEPNYRQYNEALKRAWRSLPGWSFDPNV